MQVVMTPSRTPAVADKNRLSYPYTREIITIVSAVTMIRPNPDKPEKSIL